MARASSGKKVAAKGDGKEKEKEKEEHSWMRASKEDIDVSGVCVLGCVGMGWKRWRRICFLLSCLQKSVALVQKIARVWLARKKRWDEIRQVCESGGELEEAEKKEESKKCCAHWIVLLIWFYFSLPSLSHILSSFFISSLSRFSGGQKGIF